MSEADDDDRSGIILSGEDVGLSVEREDGPRHGSLGVGAVAVTNVGFDGNRRH
jgi:hypothetical protein